jgi:hypothetical protein
MVPGVPLAGVKEVMAGLVGDVPGPGFGSFGSFLQADNIVITASNIPDARRTLIVLPFVMLMFPLQFYS